MLLIFYILLTARSQISTITLITPNTTVPMYLNNQVQTPFNDVSKKYNCALPNIYTY